MLLYFYLIAFFLVYLLNSSYSSLASEHLPINLHALSPQSVLFSLAATNNDSLRISFLDDLGLPLERYQLVHFVLSAIVENNDLRILMVCIRLLEGTLMSMLKRANTFVVKVLKRAGVLACIEGGRMAA